MIIAIIVVLLILALAGGPWWGYSRNWGYGPSGLLGLLLVVLLILWLAGALR